MRLKVEGKAARENPSMEEITKALVSLDGNDAGFAILEHNKLTYMQVSGSARSGFSLEHQDGSPKKYYRCSRDVSLEDATSAFQSYAKDDGLWRDACNWELMKMRAGGGVHLAMPKIDHSPLSLLTYALVVLCFIAVFFGSRKGANLRVPMCVIFASVALIVAAGTTQGFRKGKFRGTFYTVTRSESPFQFWLEVVSGYLMSVIILMGIILALKNLPR